MLTRALIVIVFVVIRGMLALDTIHSLDPSYQMYPAVVREWKLGVGIDPIHFQIFFVDPQFEGILLPTQYHEDCDDPHRGRTYLDLGGPKPFFTQGCSPYPTVGILGLGPGSPLWGVFSGYENRGGRITLLSKHGADGVAPTTLEGGLTGRPDFSIPSREEMLVTRYEFRAASGAITSKKSYLSRADGVPDGVTALAVAFFLVYLRSKVVRKLVYWWQESRASLVARVASALFQIIAFPVLLEFYRARHLLIQDVGEGVGWTVALTGYYASVLAALHVLLRLGLHYLLEVKSAEWAMRLDLIGNLSTSTGTILGVWFATSWYSAADSGSFIGAALLAFLLYEQMVVLFISLSNLATGLDHPTPHVLFAWWGLVLLPMVGLGLYVTTTLGIQPFLENRIPSQRIALRATVYATTALLVYIPASEVYSGLLASSRYLEEKRK